MKAISPADQPKMITEREKEALQELRGMVGHKAVSEAKIEMHFNMPDEYLTCTQAGMLINNLRQTLNKFYF